LFALAPNSRGLVARIGQRAGGVPLFIEELTKSVLDSGSTFGDSEVPETLQASLLARLDRLGQDAKELAQIAAVVGREFGAALLRAVTGKPVEALALELGRLVASEILLAAGSAADEYVSSCADQIRLSITSVSRRRQYHGAIARSWRAAFGNSGEPARADGSITPQRTPDRAIPFGLGG
jgi:predicted ATPase